MEKHDRPKLLFIDIETFPAQAYVWGVHKENIGVEQIISPPRVACFAARWLGDGREGQMFYSEWKHGRKSMLKAVHNMLSAADIVCHFFGSKFDIPWLNGEFMVERMKPTPPIPEIDLKILVASKARFISNRLAHVAPLLKIGEKMKHEGFELWRACMEGNSEARKKMEAYNRQDTALMEPLYLALRPWISNHPNMNHFRSERGCTNCGSVHVGSNGIRFAQTFAYRRLQCHDCGAWMRERLRLKDHAPTQLRGL